MTSLGYLKNSYIHTYIHMISYVVLERRMYHIVLYIWMPIKISLAPYLPTTFAVSFLHKYVQ